MKNLLVISHACVIPSFRIRWRKLAQSNEFNVHLLIPMKWEQTWFGEKLSITVLLSRIKTFLFMYLTLLRKITGESTNI